MYMCTIQWLLVYSQNWAVITTANFRTFSSSQKETGTLYLSSPYPPTPTPFPQS